MSGIGGAGACVIIVPGARGRVGVGRRRSGKNSAVSRLQHSGARRLSKQVP